MFGSSSITLIRGECEVFLLILYSIAPQIMARVLNSSYCCLTNNLIEELMCSGITGRCFFFGQVRLMLMFFCIESERDTVLIATESRSR